MIACKAIIVSRDVCRQTKKWTSLSGRRRVQRKFFCKSSHLPKPGMRIFRPASTIAAIGVCFLFHSHGDNRAYQEDESGCFLPRLVRCWHHGTGRPRLLRPESHTPAAGPSRPHCAILIVLVVRPDNLILVFYRMGN